MLSILLAYCSDDQGRAHALSADLASHVHIDHVNIGRAADGDTLAGRLAGREQPTVVLVSHAFLTNPNCLLGAYDVFARQQEVLPVLIPGPQYDELLDEEIELPLSLANRAAVMTYVNHWQDRYLDLRAQAEDLRQEGGDNFERYLSKIREASSQVEETLTLIKDGWHLSEAQLKARDYEQLFLFAERPRLWEDFRRRDEQLPELSGIPGMDQLPRTATEEGARPPVPGDGEEQGDAGADPETSPAKTTATETEERPEDNVITINYDAEGDRAGIAEPDVNDGSDLPDELPAPPPPAAADYLDPEEQAGRWIDRAWQLFDQGEVEAGKNLLATGVDAQPDHVELQFQYLLYLATAGEDPADVLEDLDELLSLVPDYGPALFLSGELHLAENRFAAARTQWEHLAESEPLYPDLNYRLGLLLREHFPDEQLKALEHLRTAAREEPTHADACYHYAKALVETGGRRKKAIKYLRKAILAEPEHAAAHYALAVQLHRGGDYAAARNAFHLASEIEPAYATEQSIAACQSERGDGDAEARARAAEEVRALTEELAASRAEQAAAIAALEQQLRDQAARMETLDAEITRLREIPPGVGRGRIALISGATSGIGRATAYALAGEGYHLILTGRREERLRDIAADLKAQHPVDVHPLVFDVRDRAAVVDAIAGLPAAWRNIDILINNAGKAKGFDPIHEGDYGHWEEMIDVNLKGLLYLTREISPIMVERGSGTILNVCSTAGKEVYPNGNVYCATKHAVDALTYALRLDLVKFGIRVGQICPAHVEETEFAVVRFDGDEERAKIYEGFQPLRSRDVAEVIRYMLERPRHVNILDVVVQGTQQASSTVVERSGRAGFAPEEE